MTSVPTNRNKSAVDSKQRSLSRFATRPESESAQLRRLIAHAQSRREEEYLCIIRALHDELLSRLVSVSLDLGELRREPQTRGSGSRFTSQVAAQRLKEAIQIAADVCAKLRPPLLEHCGLEATMRRTASEWSRRHGIRCEVADMGDLSRVSPILALELFRLFEEGLHTLMETCEPGRLRVEIATGKTAHRLTLHTRALATMARHRLLRASTFLAVRERAHRLGGKLVVRATSLSWISLAIIVPAGL